MPITRPITRTLISTTGWGIPITDEVNALRTLINSMQPTAWVGLPYVGGWVDSGAPWQAGQYCKIGTQVYIRGVMKNGGLNGSYANLPVGFRPPADLRYPGSDSMLLVINSIGAMLVYGASNSIVGITTNFSTV